MPATGSAVITAIISATGDTATTTVEVSELPELDALNLTEPSELIAAGETATLDFTAEDQYGDEVAADSDLLEGVTWTSSDDSVVADGAVTFEDGEYQVTTMGAGETTLTATKDGETVGEVTLTVEEAAVPTTIEDVTLATNYENTGSDELTLDDIEATDQYGRDIEVEGGDVEVTAEDSSFDSVSVTGDDGNNNLDEGETFVFTGTSNTDVEDVVNFSLNNDNDTFELTVQSVASEDIASYSIEELGVLYANENNDGDSDYAQELTIMGETAEGESVALADGKVSTYTTSNPSAIKVDSSDEEVYAVTEGTSTITAFDGAEQLASIEVSSSSETPVPADVTFAQSEMDLVEGATETNTVTVEDQYNVALAPEGTVASADDSVATATRSGSTISVTGVSEGTTTITYISNNGIVESFTVEVNATGGGYGY